MTAKTEIVGNAPELRDLIPVPAHDGDTFLSLHSSPEALCDHIAKVDRGSCWYSRAWDDDSGFRGTSSMTQAIGLGRAGWPEGGEKAQALRDRINAAHPTQKAYARYDVAGSIPNVQRYLAGNPASMKRIDTAKARRKPVLTLVCNTGANCGVNKQAFLNRSAVLAAIVDSIEGAGFACHVVACGHFKGSDGFMATVGVTIKESHMPADIGRMAYGLGHPSMVRRLTFGTLGEHNICKPLGTCLGQMVGTPKASEAGVYVIQDLGSMSHLFNSEDSAATVGLEKMIADLRAQDCPAFPAQQEAA